MLAQCMRKPVFFANALPSDAAGCKLETHVEGSLLPLGQPFNP